MNVLCYLEKFYIKYLLFNSLKLFKIMAPKKIKKLTLKKETIANLSGDEQNRIKGGMNTCDYACFKYTILNPGCVFSGGGSGTCLSIDASCNVSCAGACA